MTNCNEIRNATAGFSLILECDVIQSGMVRLATPFRYPDGSNIDVFVGDVTPPRLPPFPSLKVTDLGQTTAGLLDLHIKSWTTKKRKLMVADVCRALEVAHSGGEFLIEIESLDQLSDAIVRLSQACIRVSDLVMTQRLSTPLSFRDDLEEFLAVQDLAYNADIAVPGKYGRDVAVDFEVKGSHMESLVLTLTAGSTATSHPVSNEVFRKWHDLEMLRHTKQFMSVYDSRSNVFREDDIARLRDVSTVLAYPDEQETIRAALAA